jgi:hypothetical protein
VVAAKLGAAAPAYLTDVSNAFLSGLAVACLVVAGVALVGACVAGRFLPARAVEVEPLDVVEAVPALGAAARGRCAAEPLYAE